MVRKRKRNDLLYIQNQSNLNLSDGSREYDPIMTFITVKSVLPNLLDVGGARVAAVAIWAHRLKLGLGKDDI